MKSIPEKYISGLAIAGLLLICLIFFHQPLFSGEVVNATDILTQQYFWNVFIKENLFADPCFRTWLPYINAGTPFGGGLHLIFRPVTFLTLLILPVHLAINYEIVIYFFLLGVGMYLYMRELQVSPLSSFLAALFFMLSGQIVSLINAGHVNKIGAIFPVAFVFWAFERALQRKTLTAFMVAGATLGFQFWQGHIQISYYLCIAVGIYYLIRIGILFRHNRSIKQISLLTVFAVVMVVVFLLLSAVEFLPLLSFAQISERAKGVSYEFATNWSMPPEELVTYMIPGFFGFRRRNHYEDEQNVLEVPYWGRMPFTQTGHYLGLLPLLLMFLAVCFVRNKYVLTLAVLAFVVLLLGMGKYIPTYKLLYEYAPGFNKFRVPQSILYLFAFAASALAGFGAEWLLSDFSESKEKRLRIFLLVCIAIFLFAWLITIMLPQASATFIAWFQEALLRKGADSDIAAARLRNIFTGLLQFNLLFGIALFVLGLRLAKDLRIRWIVLAIMLLYLIDIGFFNSKYIDTIPLEGSFYVSENDSIRYFQEHPGLYRFLPATNTPDPYNVANKYLSYHLFSISGYEAVGVQYYNEYLENMALGTALVDLLNIKYIILPKGAQINEQEVKLGDTIGPYKVAMDADALLLENRNALPRAFPVHNARVLKTPDEIFPALLHPSFDPREVVILEENPNVRMSPERIPSSQSKAEIVQYANRTIQLRASMATDGFLVLSERYYPGWKAYVDGQQTKIYKANYTLQAIFLPKGDHVITFAFQPIQFMLGFIITMITCFSIAGVLIGKTFLSRQKFIMIYESIEYMLRERYGVDYAKKLLWGLICFGIMLHVIQYAGNPVFSVDEVDTVLSMLKKPFSGLLQPLDYRVSAPVGFIAIEKFLVLLFGDSEYVLRIFPLLCRILSVALFYYIAPYFIKSASVPFALGLFVFSERLFSFSTIVKQYSSDVFFALLIYAIVLRLQSKGITVSGVILLGVSGALVIWCSFPVAFVLAGVGVSMAFSYGKQRNWKAMFHLLPAYMLWTLSFLVLYISLLRDLNTDVYLNPLSERSFMPFPLSLADLKLIVKAFVDYMGYTIGWSQAIFSTMYSRSLFDLLTVVARQITSSGTSFATLIGFFLFGLSWSFLYFIAVCMFFLGCLSFFRKNKKHLGFLMLPACFLFLASGIFKITLRHRLLFLLFPPIILCIVEGIGYIRARIGKRSMLLGWALAGLFLVYPVLITSYQVIKPGEEQNIKPIIQYLKTHKQKGDVIYVYYGAQRLFEYYSNRFGGFEDDVWIVGIYSRDNWGNYIRDLNQLRGNKRVWILFSHIYGYEEMLFISYLNDIGTRLDAFRGINTGVYLFDLSQP